MRAAVAWAGHTNVAETTIIGSPLASVPEMMVTVSRFLPSFLPSCASLSTPRACRIDRRLTSADRAKGLRRVIVLFITQGIFIARATAGSGENASEKKKNRCLGGRRSERKGVEKRR